MLKEANIIAYVRKFNLTSSISLTNIEFWKRPISTYGGRGVTKRGVIAKDHTIIYTGDQAPDRLEGEEAMYKEPIRVIPDPGALLDSRSRLNFGKVYTVEHNVKVKNIGVVDKMDIPKLEKAHLALLLQE